MTDNSKHYEVYRTLACPIRIMKALEDAQFSMKFKSILRKKIHKSEIDYTDFLAMVKVLLETLKTFKPHDKKRTVTFLRCDDRNTLEKFIRNYSCINDPLLIKTKKSQDFNIIWKDFQKLLKYYGIEDQKLVIIGFPKSKIDLKQLQMTRINPDQVLILNNSGSVNDCTSFNHCLKSKFENMTKEIHHQGSFKATCDEIHKSIVASKPTHGPCTIKFFPRTVIIGARGAGCHVQAKYLCERFNFVFVDAREIFRMIDDSFHMDESYVQSSIIYERLMQPDCLHHGYVLIGYPNTKIEMEFLFRTFIAPNRIIFLHSGKNLCYQRKYKQMCGYVKNGMSCEIVATELKIIQNDIDRVNQIIPDFVKMCGKRDEVNHINANRSLDNVRKEIFSCFSQ